MYLILTKVISNKKGLITLLILGNQDEGLPTATALVEDEISLKTIQKEEQYNVEIFRENDLTKKAMEGKNEENFHDDAKIENNFCPTSPEKTTILAKKDQNIDDWYENEALSNRTKNNKKSIKKSKKNSKNKNKSSSSSPGNAHNKPTKCPENEDKSMILEDENKENKSTNYSENEEKSNAMILEDRDNIENLPNEKMILEVDKNIENFSNENFVKSNSNDQIQSNVLTYSNDLETSPKIVENSQSSNVGDEKDHVMEENVSVNLTPGDYKKNIFMKLCFVISCLFTFF